MKTAIISTLISVGALLIGLQIGGQGGQVKGCQTLASSVIDMHFSPRCALQNSKLVVELTNPITGAKILMDAATGQEIKE